MKKGLQLLVVISVFLIFALTGCGAQSNDQVKEQQTTDETVITKSDFPVTVVDATGEELTIESSPERIVSLIPSNTEISFAIGAGEQIVGVTDWDNYPEEVTEIAKVGGLEVNSESILALQPDLVLAHTSSTGSSEQALDQLKQAGITVVVIPSATSISDVYDSIDLIGKVTGHAQSSAKIIDQMKERVEKVAEKAELISEAEKKTVWVEVQPEPEIYTTGKGTFMHEILELIGAKNAAADGEGWLKYTEEDAVLLNPDVIVVTYGYYVDKPIEKVLGRLAWQDVNAVTNKKVFAVDSDKFTRAGPRLVEGVEELAKLVYPNIYQ
ncbi:ABC transporter substrate-binding protein [Bacillus solimangrovi]|uniref:Iron ABC transporter substrate-binding protein n=1 Tax=Bacillus solimangrovi TaxID=1305675 RepID=A0A1E5LHG4_9BACI|nr:ABC transporter substrate-binding protein [Bacillus solimangrovi]OEH93522.1 iron ABC transporter substrate-binding protein [Bacillus solimangrovi]